MRLLVFHLLVSKPQGRLQVIVRLLLGTFRAPNLHVKFKNTQFEKRGSSFQLTKMVSLGRG